MAIAEPFPPPRFWAEEGQFYYNVLQSGDSPLTLVMRGNYQLITNLICYVATLVPTEWAAHVTTYGSLLVASWCIVLFSRFSIENGWPLTRAAMAVAILALCAQGYEVYLTSTNVQWLCAVSLLFIGITSWADLRGTRKALLYTWVAICALSGVPASIMTPVFLVKGTLLRSGIHFRLGLILAVGTAIQAAIIILHPQPDRLLSPTVLTMTAPWLLQTVASPIFTGGGTELLVFFPALAAKQCRPGIGVCRALVDRGICIGGELSGSQGQNHRNRARAGMDSRSQHSDAWCAGRYP